MSRQPDERRNRESGDTYPISSGGPGSSRDTHPISQTTTEIKGHVPIPCAVARSSACDVSDERFAVKGRPVCVWLPIEEGSRECRIQNPNPR